jgi:RNA polymerase sigma-70 factor (ECF subfamily)
MDELGQEIERLYRHRYLQFRNGVSTITGSRETARDVVQEAFARAFRRRASFRGEGSLEAWVWKIALRTAWEQRRKAGTAGSNGSVETALPEPDRDPVLAEALRSLPPKRRLIVFLHYFADLSYGEIAELCGVSEGTVGATLSKARAALEELLREETVSERR